MSSHSPELKATIVQAGAGTGKTQSLATEILRVAQIVEQASKRTPRLVATTFTERATAELRERVVQILSVQAEAPLWLKNFVQDTENLHISTIHGTLSLFLHRYGSLIGLDPDFIVIKKTEERQILQKALRRALSSDEAFGLLLDHYSFFELVDLLDKLVPHQRLHKDNQRPALNWEEHLSKDVSRLKEALSAFESVAPEEFTEKGAELVNTFQNLSRHLSQIQDLEEIQRVFRDKLGQSRKPSGARFKDFSSALEVIFDQIKNKWSKKNWSNKYTVELNRRHNEIAPVIQKLTVVVAQFMEDEKKTKGLMAFDDLEFFSLALVQEHPEILESWRKEWDFWFIDEYQDTSPLQKKILFEFFKKPWNAYFVGDPQQSIYLFRGADENVFQDTKKDVQKNNGRLERLAVNYRSQPDLMSFLNLIFSKLKTPMDELEANGEKTGGIEGAVLLAQETVSENDLIVHQVTRWINTGIPVEDIAILVKKNTKAREMAKALEDVGVPVYMHTSGGFYEQREVKDALSLLTFIEDPSDDLNFVLLCRSPWLGVKDEDLAQWGMSRGSKTFWDWLSSSPAEKEKYPALKVLEKAIVEGDVLPLSFVLSKLITDLGLYEFGLIGDSSGKKEANIRKLLFTLKKAEESPDFSASEFLHRAWHEVEDESEETEAAGFVEPERLNIMTVHKSKGLKFNYVIVPGCGDGFKPVEAPIELSPDGQWAARVLAPETEEKVGPLMHGYLRDLRTQRELAESLRVFYVAITRAAKKLTLVGNVKRNSTSWFGQLNLDFDEGIHDGCYTVEIFDEPPAIVLRPQAEVKAAESEVFKAPPVVSQENPFRLSVTQMVQGTQNIVKVQDQLESQYRGMALHWVFEHFKHQGFENVEGLCLTANTKFALQAPLKTDLIKKILDHDEAPLKDVIQRGRVEWPFVYRENGVTVRGQVDLWGESKGTTWIFDYKSLNKFSEEKISRAREQLEYYALAVHKTGVPWENVKIAVVAPHAGEIKVLNLSSVEDVRRRLTAAASAPTVSS